MKLSRIPWTWVAVIVALAAAPAVLGSFRLGFLTEILIFGLFAASLDLLVGHTGMVSLGHSAYFGLGGYAAALLALHGTDQAVGGLLVGVLVAAVGALVTGAVAVRLAGMTFLMLTLAVAQIAASLAVTWTAVTGGSNGLSGIPSVRAWSLVSESTLRTVTGFCFYAAVIVVVALWGLRRVEGSPFGHVLRGIDANPERMTSLGYPIYVYKLAAFALAGAMAGLSGALFVQHQRFVSPANVSLEVSILALLMVIIGGRGNLAGAVLGAAVVLWFRDTLSTEFELWRLALGIVFILVVYLLPGGISGLARSLSAKFADRLSAAEVADGADDAGPADDRVEAQA